ncbi:MAG: protein-glutamate methylesterase/protein-glutamine glutaminase [Thalassotalea sp.]
MAYKVLVVDDSSFFRRRLSDILSKESELEVIDVAVDGIDAVKKAIALKPDVITMDIEMPLLNGIEAVKQIMAKAPTSILMFSSLTHQGAKATLDALQAGALDFLPKKFNEIAANSEDAGKLLRERVLQLARKKNRIRPRLSSNRPTLVESLKAVRTPVIRKPATDQKPVVATRWIKKNKSYKLLAIGTSTGGPIALQTVLANIPADFPVPIILIQHMPAAFTPAFASRLNSLCKIKVKEAESGDILKAGCAYLAPGGRQMVIDGTNSAAKIKVLDDNSPRITYKPSVDISFGSAAKIYQGDVLALILTGMGSDGREGSRMLKGKGATIWAQDEESCVVYGMPQAVTMAGLTELSLPLAEITDTLIKEITNG